MTDHHYCPQGNSLDDYFLNSSVQTAYVFPRLYVSDLSCFNVDVPTREIRLCVYQTLKWHLLKLETGTYKVRNEIETKRNEINENETKRNEINETKRNENEMKRNQRKQNEIN